MASSNSLWDQLEDYLLRLLRLVTVLVDTHLDMAVQEASYESRRLIGGLLMLAIGGVLVGSGVVLGQVAAIVLAEELGLSWLQAIGVVAGGNLLLGLLLVLGGRWRLRGPLMTQTQARLARSVALLRAKE